MKTFTLKKYKNKYDILLQVRSYFNGNLLIQMLHYEGGDWEPFSTLTVNFPIVLSKDCAFIDTNNNGSDILTWIVRNGLAVPTGRTAESGFCSYPEYRFRAAALEECDPSGYATYLEKQKARNRA